MNLPLIQIIEIETENPDVVTALHHRWEKDSGQRTHRQYHFCADRDRPNTYLAVAEFDTPEDALLHTQDPATQQLMIEITDLCGAPPRVHNLTVIRTSGSNDHIQRVA
jgi:hypothetical protein